MWTQEDRKQTDSISCNQQAPKTHTLHREMQSVAHVYVCVGAVRMRMRVQEKENRLRSYRNNSEIGVTLLKTDG